RPCAEQHQCPRRRQPSPLGQPQQQQLQQQAQQEVPRGARRRERDADAPRPPAAAPAPLEALVLGAAAKPPRQKPPVPEEPTGLGALLLTDPTQTFRDPGKPAAPTAGSAELPAALLFGGSESSPGTVPAP
ncbi:MAG: hypothetical protein AAGH15_27510, partial [Myxococcota bacterium]